LRVPVAAVLNGGEILPAQFPSTSSQARLPRDQQGPCEEVDPIDAAIAITSKQGLRTFPREVIADPRPRHGRKSEYSYDPFSPPTLKQVEQAFNLGKAPDDWRKLARVSRHPGSGDLLFIDPMETPNEARKRWQHEVSPKSFHGAIIGNAENHCNVTAYDVAIGGGKASSDPRFYRYLCAVADWRLKKSDSLRDRPGIEKWNDFIKTFNAYWSDETVERKVLIEGSVDYYSTGTLPACVPALHVGLPSTVVCEIINGRRTESAIAPKTHKPSDDIPK
ncbi:DUF3274 domain-containing protein, partial [Janthinobacterium sp. S3M3]|uniref:effector protein Tle3 domain-containing protein n=2 Tax=unclassified Janthinobacterium TaxID=2610881 RepID=UPI0016196FF6